MTTDAMFRCENPRWRCGILVLKVAVFLVSASVLLADTDLADIDPEVKQAAIWDCSDEHATNLVWRVKIGWQSGPLALSDGKILAGTSFGRDPRNDQLTGDCGVMMCFNSETGQFLWQATHPRLPERINDISGFPINSRPWIEGRRAWYVSNSGELVCVDMQGFRDGKNDGPFIAEEKTGPTDADFVWKLDMIRELGVFKRGASDVGNPICSPVVLGDLVFCVTGEGRRRAGDRGSASSFLAVNKVSGQVVWSSSAPGKAIMHSQWSSPAIARVNGQDQVIFPGGDGCLYGFEPQSGRLIWKVNCNETSAKDWSITDTVFSPGELKHFFVGTPTVHKNTVYVCLNRDLESPQTNAPLYAISLSQNNDTIAVRWKFQHPEFGSTYTSATVADGIVYVLGWKGVLFVLDEKTGGEIWHSQLDVDERACFYGSPYLADGKVFAGLQGGDLVMFATGRKKKCLGRFRLHDRLDQAPVVNKGCVYISDGGFLWKLRLPE